jgi:hypothetical protein
VVWPETPDQPPAEPVGWEIHSLSYDVAGHRGDSKGTVRMLSGGPPKPLREMLATPSRLRTGARRLLSGPDAWVWEEGDRWYQVSVGRSDVFALDKPPPNLPLAVARDRVSGFEIASMREYVEVGEYRPVTHAGRPGVDVTVSAGPYHVVARIVVDEAAQLVYQAEVSVPREVGRLRSDDPKVRAFLDGLAPPPPGAK